MTRRAVLLLLLLSLPAVALAHDYWLEPAAQGSVDQPLDIRMWVGDSFHKGEEKPYRKKKAASFVYVSGAGTVDLKPQAVDQATPVITVTPAASGGHLVAMSRSSSKVSLPGWRFTSYLSHEKLEEALEARKAAGTTWDEGRERYTRYLKTLVQVGDTRDEVYGTVLGHAFEIVPLNDPTTVAPGEALVVRILFEGQPKPGVRAMARSKAKDEVEAVTDENGVARLVLPSAGVWLARAVFMRPCAGCSDAEWQSFWAAYQFSNATAGG